MNTIMIRISYSVSLLVALIVSVVFVLSGRFYVYLTPLFWALSALALVSWFFFVFMSFRSVRERGASRPVIRVMGVFISYPVAMALGALLGFVQTEGSLLFNLLETLHLHDGTWTICNLGHNPYGYDSGCAPSDQ